MTDCELGEEKYNSELTASLYEQTEKEMTADQADNDKKSSKRANKTAISKKSRASKKSTKKAASKKEKAKVSKEEKTSNEKTGMVSEEEAKSKKEKGKASEEEKMSKKQKGKTVEKDTKTKEEHGKEKETQEVEVEPTGPAEGEQKTVPMKEKTAKSEKVIKSTATLSPDETLTFILANPDGGPGITLNDIGVVMEVATDTPASRRLQLGDQVIEVNKKPIGSSKDYLKIVYDSGREIEIVVKRMKPLPPDREFNILIRHHGYFYAIVQVAAKQSFPSAGVELVALHSGFYKGNPMVKDVTEGGPFENMLIKRDRIIDINCELVSIPEEAMQKLSESLANEGSVSILVERPQSAEELVLAESMLQPKLQSEAAPPQPDKEQAAAEAPASDGKKKKKCSIM